MAAQSIDHKLILFNIAEYLQELKATPGLVEEEAAESLDVATQCISSVFGLDITDVEHQKRYSFKPKSFAEIIAQGLAASQKTETTQKASGLDHDLEAKFQQYIQLAAQKGYFNGVNPGTPEYEQRYAKAKAKFVESQAKPKQPEPVQFTQEEKLKYAEQHKVEGNQHLANKDYVKAIESYTRAVELNPDNAIYYSNRAAAHSHMNNHQLAIDDCLVAIQKNPSYSKPYGRLGLSYFSLGKYQEAVEYYRKAVLLEPGSDSLKASLEAAEKKLTEPQDKPATKPPVGVVDSNPGLNYSEMLSNPEFANMAQSVMNNMGQQNQQPSSSTGGARPTPNFNEILGNPMFQNMAQQFLSNPAMMNMAQSLLSNPDSLNNLMSGLGVNPNDLAGMLGNLPRQQ